MGLESDDIAKEIPFNVSVSTRSSDGSPTHVRFTCTLWMRQLNLQHPDGELFLTINSTTLADSTVSVSDWSSHAIIACIGHDPLLNHTLLVAP